MIKLNPGESLNIKMDLMVNKGRKIKEVSKSLEFATVEEFGAYKQAFYAYLMSKGWKREPRSANQCYRGKFTLTPFFIKEF